MELLLQADLFGADTLPLVLLTAGLVLSILEAIAPGANFIIVGIALLGAGLVGLALGPLATPFALALLVLAFGGVTFYGYREFDIYGGKGQQQTRDSQTLKGTTGHVTERVTPTSGEVKLSSGGFSPYYSARSVDTEISEGTEVMVTDPGGGNVVTVESTEIVRDEIDRELARGRKKGQPESQSADESRLDGIDDIENLGDLQSGGETTDSDKSGDSREFDQERN
jgi:Membrane protein implicated in regulation of membrane protease activity